jgi:hypothetical protein
LPVAGEPVAVEGLVEDLTRGAAIREVADGHCAKAALIEIDLLNHFDLVLVSGLKE